MGSSRLGPPLGTLDNIGLTPEHLQLAWKILGKLREPDKVIAPDGEPYIYRWELVKTLAGCVYFHVQVRSDPERPFHDHPWDNMSVILAGGYMEYFEDPRLPFSDGCRLVRAGATVYRDAELAHRLVLPDGVPYTMTLFTTGPKRREWGFWYPQGWVNFQEVCELRGNTSIHKEMGEQP